MGQPITSGERAFVMPTAANRNPVATESSDQRDITRRRGCHPARGVDAHYRLGEVRTRAQRRVTIPQGPDRSPDVACIGKRFEVDRVILDQGLGPLPGRLIGE